MAASPQWKVYDATGTYRAACHDIEAAAILATFYSDNSEISPGATIRSGHRIVVWIEGPTEDGFDGRATDSYDEVAERVEERLRTDKRSPRSRRSPARSSHTPAATNGDAP